MKVAELDFQYPEELVATERAPGRSRVMWVDPKGPRELARFEDLLEFFEPGDCLVINDTKVLKRRVFSESGLEILFLESVRDEQTGIENRSRWKALCPSSRWKPDREQILPHGVRLKLLERGRTQVVESSEPLSEDYFEKAGELPLPPYIQKARGERHNRQGDLAQYQTAWAEQAGSLAAPTASLHLSTQDLETLRSRGVEIAKITLHVGLGTFLPITAEDLTQHLMHAESVTISREAWQLIQATRAKGKRVWALGTTVTRSLESAAHGRLAAAPNGGFEGSTDLFIRPGFEFKVVDVLMTNFHQPRSTLLALVGAFSGLDNVKNAYTWAIERKFRLFSYGDFSVWTK